MKQVSSASKTHHATKIHKVHRKADAFSKVCANGVRVVQKLVNIGNHIGVSQWKVQFHNKTDYKYRIIEADDVEGENLEQYFEDSFEFIEKCKREGGRVFVHCNFGKSRSVTFVAAYIMRSQQVSMYKALHIVKQTRPFAHPNVGFLKQLKKYEEKMGIKEKTTKEQYEQLKDTKTWTTGHLLAFKVVVVSLTGLLIWRLVS